jgi:hypothetical protein
MSRPIRDITVPIRAVLRFPSESIGVLAVSLSLSPQSHQIAPQQEAQRERYWCDARRLGMSAVQCAAHDEAIIAWAATTTYSNSAAWTWAWENTLHRLRSGKTPHTFGPNIDDELRRENLERVLGLWD